MTNKYWILLQISCVIFIVSGVIGVSRTNHLTLAAPLTDEPTPVPLQPLDDSPPPPKNSSPKIHQALVANTVIINEVAWGGTAASSSDEWVELYNATTQTITLADWRITSEGGLNIPLNGYLAPESYYLLERSDDQTVSDILADLIYTGSLNNQGDTLSLYQGDTIVDTANLAGSAWPAGSGSPDYRSMERVSVTAADAPSNWISHDQFHRNGLDAAGQPLNGTPKQANSTTYPAAPVIPLLISEVLYEATTPKTNGDEFVEICNPTTEIASLRGYKVGDEETAGQSEGMYRFPDETTLAPQACLIVAKNAANFVARFGLLPEFEVVTRGEGYEDLAAVPNLSRYTRWGQGNWALADHRDELLLLGPNDEVVDAIAFQGGAYAILGLTPSARADAPLSLQRVWPSDSDWMAADFFADIPTPKLTAPLPAPTVFSPAPALADGMQAYLGLLQGQSTFSAGSRPPHLMFAEAKAQGLHFLGLTDLGDQLSDQAWSATQSWAAQATVSNTFVALSGFMWQEDSSLQSRAEQESEVGPISIFGQDQTIHPQHLQRATLLDVYAYLVAHPTLVGQLHADFDLPPYVVDATPLFALYQITEMAQLYRAWAIGWPLAPSTQATEAHPQARTGLIAPHLSPADLFAAIRARRVFVTEDENLVLALRGRSAGTQSVWMGGQIDAGETEFDISLLDADGETATMTVYEGNIPLISLDVTVPSTTTLTLETQPGQVYWVLAEQLDGDQAHTAPLWTKGQAQAKQIWLNEVLPAPKDWDWDGNGEANSQDEWLELFNPNARAVSLSGWSVQDASGKSYIFPEEAIIKAQGYYILYRAVSNIALNNSDETIVLQRLDGSVADSLTYSKSPGSDISLCRLPSGKAWHDRCIPTPMNENDELPPEQPLSLSIYDAKQVTEGAWVRVRGYVTVPPDVFGVNVMYIQDDRHGIRVKLPSKHGRFFELGHHVEVTGYLDLFWHEWEIDIRDAKDIKLLEGHRLITPLPIGSGLLREGYEGLLVQVTLQPLAFEKRKRHFWGDDGTGLAYIYVYSKTGIKRRGLTLDAPMTIVGIAGQRTRSPDPIDGYRLYPRYQFDIIQHQIEEEDASPVPEGWPSELPETGR